MLWLILVYGVGLDSLLWKCSILCDKQSSYDPFFGTACSLNIWIKHPWSLQIFPFYGFNKVTNYISFCQQKIKLDNLRNHCREQKNSVPGISVGFTGACFQHTHSPRGPVCFIYSASPHRDTQPEDLYAKMASLIGINRILLT